MCGIAGLFSYDPRPDRGALHHAAKAMTDALSLRGPDSGDVWQDPNVPLVLGHRRLSIIDLSEAGHQPMESQSSRYMIVFNGEIYNFRELREELSGFGHRFNGGSDTEVLLAAIEQWGFDDTLPKLNGMFAFALWDRKAQALFFARDRMGKKPLYIGWAGSTLVFASEMKAVMAHPDFCRVVNKYALCAYMRFGYVPAPMSIFEHMVQLPAGGKMALDMRMLRGGHNLTPLIDTYWQAKTTLEDARKTPITDEAQALDAFDALLGQCVQDRLISDVPLGAFLSGGIDSSAVVAMMQKYSSAPVKTYTIGFEEEGYNEAEHAKQIAAHLGTEHHEMYVKAEDALSVVRKLPSMYDEPFADASAIPTYLVSKFARESVTVALSGDGGDEMLGGYNRHIKGPAVWNAVQKIPPNLRGPFSQVIASVSPAKWSKLRPKSPQFGEHMHKFAQALQKNAESDVYLSLVSTWQDAKALTRVSEERMVPLVDPKMQVDCPLSFAEQMMYWDTISYLNGDVLTKVDRATMAVSLEARAPLLDQRIYDFVWQLPPEMKIRDGKGKWLLRETLKRYVPDELFERPKQGFSVPIAHWLRHDLKDWAYDLLDEKKLREQGHFDYKMISDLWEQHQKGRGNHAQRLWSVLMFQSWREQWIEK